MNVKTDVFHIMSFEGHGNIATKAESFTQIHYSGLNGDVFCVSINSLDRWQ